jgi:hypothetical protein
MTRISRLECSKATLSSNSSNPEPPTLVARIEKEVDDLFKRKARFDWKDALESQLRRTNTDRKEIQRVMTEWNDRLNDSIEEEQQKIEEEQMIFLYFDPIEWWSSIGKEKYPLVYPLALPRLMKQSHNAFMERAFSANTLIDGVLRQSLGDENFELKALLRINRDLILQKFYHVYQKEISVLAELNRNLVGLDLDKGTEHLGMIMNLRRNKEKLK